MQRSIFPLALLASLLAMGCNKKPSGCTADTDCKGDRVCEDGACVDGKAAPAATAQSGAPLPSASPIVLATASATPIHAPTPIPTQAPTATAKVDPAERAAAVDNINRFVLSCFHPSASYVRGTFGHEYKDADGRTTQDGHIDFAGGITGHEYSMDYVWHEKRDAGDRLIRVTPGKDTAFTKPDPACTLRNWTRLN